MAFSLTETMRDHCLENMSRTHTVSPNGTLHHMSFGFRRFLPVSASSVSPPGTMQWSKTLTRGSRRPIQTVSETVMKEFVAYLS